MIEIKEGRYFAHIWFVGGGKAGVDWMGALWRETDSTEWHLQYRFRYYSKESKDPFDQKDRKSWHHMKGPGPEEQVQAAGEVVARLAHVQYGGIFESIPVRSADPETVGKVFQTASWAHGKEIKPGDSDYPEDLR